MSLKMTVCVCRRLKSRQKAATACHSEVTLGHFCDQLGVVACVFSHGPYMDGMWSYVHHYNTGWAERSSALYGTRKVSVQAVLSGSLGGPLTL
jgi:hypothetical protein